MDLKSNHHHKEYQSQLLYFLYCYLLAYIFVKKKLKGTKGKDNKLEK